MSEPVHKKPWWQKIWDWSRFWLPKEPEPTRDEIVGPVDVYLRLDGGPEELIGRFKTHKDAEWGAQAHVVKIVMRTGEHASASVRYQAVLPQTKGAPT